MRDKNPYNELYKQIDMATKPFGYTTDYVLWRAAKLKGEFAKYITKNGKVLDVGGGYGVMAKFLSDFADRENYYNLDVSIEMLKYSPYQNILASAEHIPFRDASFVYVILSEVLEHVNSKLKALRECYRVLKPGGLFLLSTPRTGWMNDFRRSPFYFLLFLVIGVVLDKIRPLKSEFKMPQGVRDEPSDEKWLKETLGNIGFTVLEQYRADNHVPWRKAGESKFWRWFADKFVDPRRYGHCTIVICSK